VIGKAKRYWSLLSSIMNNDDITRDLDCAEGKTDLS
jgi:hypothetical protein